MNGFIVNESAAGLKESIKENIEKEDNIKIKKYFQAVYDLPADEQEKWFVYGDRIVDLSDGRKNFKEVVKTVCREIKKIIKIYNAIKEAWEEIEQIIKECHKEIIKVPIEEPENSTGSDQPAAPTNSDSLYFKPTYDTTE